MLWTYEKEYIHKDGHLVPVLLNGVRVIGSDNEIYTWSCVQDITARKKVELREHNRSYVLELIASDELLPVILQAIVQGLKKKTLPCYVVF